MTSSRSPACLILALVGASLGTSCLPSRHLSSSIFGAQYRSHPVEVFSMGVGTLPDGQRGTHYLHLRLAVKNSAMEGDLLVDPRDQLLWLVEGFPITPTFADAGGKSGVMRVLPQRHKNLDLYYRVPEEVDEATFAWSVVAADGTGASDRLALKALQTRPAAPQLAIWVPAGEGLHDYDIGPLSPWAAPQPNWYWWRESDFPAWTAPHITFDASDRPTIAFGGEMWCWAEQPASGWPLVPSPPEIRVTEAYDSVPLPGPAPARQSRQFSGWRRHVQAPRPQWRAAPSWAPSEAAELPARAPAASPDRRTEDPAPSSAAPPRSEASSVGRSWRDKR